ncbi:hypothetical protein NDU88_002654 [Pleurodeles waltl]|uniref:Uncharacterized protein n=1 Tax=Pleurodeles waltl TaxID=8319 RepID=A0AAV7UAB9_PLEWA|nr:hypothetical protein NDU88_002654 [Pleurodeles waltl]
MLEGHDLAANQFKDGEGGNNGNNDPGEDGKWCKEGTVVSTQRQALPVAHIDVHSNKYGNCDPEWGGVSKMATRVAA